ncbi:hypothetical protein M8C21_018099 [Ambrosia artemisiifolia]|uniref:HTH OST-type domain-containing protein n=1 Tax=Ambrosia artemisiifolia TaxID=4212 RepID=A0AAD5GKE5_AMBAR|nr:hypothetical protein M8C21_018099 [Ambrosia artemisiifolia]
MEQTQLSIQTTTSPEQNRNGSDGAIAILWDMENCPVPNDVRPEDVAGNIRMALRVHPIINGVVTMFSAYGDFNGFPRRLREGCQRTGVKLIDVPNGRKDAADKAILVDMFLFALDNPPPSTIMLISGDVDFSTALHVLGQRGYTVILVIPSGVGVSSALSNAASFLWDWPSVVRGEGFVPARGMRMGAADASSLLMSCQITDSSELQNEEEAIVYRGISRTYCNSNNFSTTSRSYSFPCGLNNDLTWVQPGDLAGLKCQLVKLLESFNGCLALARLPAEYQKRFGRPLYVSEYGTLKLVNLLGKMDDKIGVEGKGQRKFVYLRKCLGGDASTLGKIDMKGKGTRDENTCVVSSDELSDDERVVLEDEDESLDKFRFELQEILVSYSCGIFLGFFEAIYQRRYKRPLDFQRFGVSELEELFEKVDDVVVVLEDPVSKKKFLVAAGC